jgi:hypothetical protein
VSLAGFNKHVQLWLWFKRTVLNNKESLLEVLLSSQSADDMARVVRASGINLYAQVPKELRRAAGRKRSAAEAQPYLGKQIWQYLEQLRELRRSGLDVADGVAGVDGLSIVTTATLELKRGQELSALRGQAVPVRASHCADAKALNSFVAADSGTAGGQEKLLFGFLSLAAHSCVPAFQLQKAADAKASPAARRVSKSAGAPEQFVLRATRKLVLPPGSVVAFSYTAPDKLWFDCRCEHADKHRQPEDKAAAARKRKLEAEQRDERARKRQRVL